MKTNSHIQLPVYSLTSFSASNKGSRPFQAEIFDANRHFAVQYPHRHDFFEVLYLRKGSGYHIIDANRYEIQPPCVFFMSPGQAHKLTLSQDIEGYIYIFTSEFFLIDKTNQNALLELPFFFTLQHTNPPLHLKQKEDQRFVEMLFVKSAEEALKTDYDVSLMRSLLELILSYLAHLYPNSNPLLTKGKGHLLVKRFYQLAEENYKKNLNITQYASLLNVSPNYLTATTKRLTGKSSLRILKEKQILEIKRLLSQTTLDMQEIANQMNFEDQSYFTKFFKRETGMTPLCFRNESQSSSVEL
ncbi:MAG: helix-turn-helix domain-containing protein [Paludibacteraceae bacterium]|nr:helix-turn-helix domain-containing protein [Paludibacteraceae bacterium]